MHKSPDPSRSRGTDGIDLSTESFTIRERLTRMNLEDMTQGERLEKVFSEIDVLESDAHRGRIALKNGLEPTEATWSEINAVARNRSAANLGLKEDPSLADIVAARRELRAKVMTAALEGKTADLNPDNPEVAFAMVSVSKQLYEGSANLIDRLRGRKSE